MPPPKTDGKRESSNFRYYLELAASVIISGGVVFGAITWAGDQRWEKKGEVKYQMLSLKISELTTKKEACRMRTNQNGCWKDYEQAQLNEYTRQLNDIKRKQ